MAENIVGSSLPSLASDQAGVNRDARHDAELKARKRSLASDQNRTDDQQGQNGPAPSWTTVGHQPSRGINIDPPKGDPVLDAVKASGVALSGRSAPENSIAKLSEQNRHGQHGVPVHDSMHPANSGPRSGGEPNVPAKLAGAPK